MAFGEVADGLRLRVRHPHMNELLKHSIWRNHAKSAVLGSHQRYRGFCDPSQYLLQLKLFDDGAIGLQEATQSALRLQYALGVKHELFDGAFEFGPRCIREVETLFVSTNPLYSYLSSSLVKEVAGHGGDVEGLVPDQVRQHLIERLAAAAQT